MTASEFAFLALGLVLGVASGSALVMVLGSRPSAREVRLTVEHDAIPRRGATLSADAFNAAHGEVARGGPADRRLMDRDMPVSDPPGHRPMPILAPAAPRPVMSPIMRTPVPSRGPGSGASGFPIVAERDPSLDALRIQAALTAERLVRAGLPTATALLEPVTMERASGAAAPAALAWPAVAWPPVRDTEPVRETEPASAETPDETPAIARILRGDYRALLAIVFLMAGDDDAARRPWFTALRGMADAVSKRAILDGCLDFRVGNPFWDTFTIDQCRLIAGALAAAGFRFDGVGAWEDGRVPGYRDLTAAVAGAGLEPRRIRAWPTREEIAALYTGATAASDEYLLAHAPTLDLEEVQATIPAGGAERAFLWGAWERLRPALMSRVAAS